MSTAPTSTRPEAATHPPRSWWRHWRPLLVRMHFYGGVLVAPFIVVACLSGLLWTFTPQLERAIYRDLLVVAPQSQTVGIDAQVAAARAARPGQTLVAVDPASAPDEPTRVDFLDPAIREPMKYRTVFVDPYRGTVLGDLVTSHGTTPFTQWVSALHGDLHLGEPGRAYAELASDWLIVLTVGGILLWWEHVTRHRGRSGRGVWRRFWLPETRGHAGVHRTTSWHATAGTATALVALLLAVTGLFFSAGAGGTWRALTAAAGQSAAVLDVWLPGQRPAVEPAAGGHGDAATAAPPRPAVPATVSIQAYLDAAAAAGIVHEPRVAAPAVAGQGWTVTESDSLLPTHWDAALIDPATGAVVRTAAFSDTPPLGQIYRYAMVFHFGRLLGWPGQILFAITTIAVTASAYWGYRMWWQRRPRGSGWRPGRAPAAGAWRAAPSVQLWIGAFVALYVAAISPVFLVSVLIFLLVDWAIGERRAGGHGH